MMHRPVSALSGAIVSSVMRVFHSSNYCCSPRRISQNPLLVQHSSLLADDNDNVVEMKVITDVVRNNELIF